MTGPQDLEEVAQEVLRGRLQILSPSGGDDTAQINAALNVGGGTVQNTVILKGNRAGNTFTVGASGAGANGAACSIPSMTTLILWDATLKLANSAQIPALMNANPQAATDHDICVRGWGQATIDGNAANNPQVGGALTGWKSMTTIWQGVTNLTIENITCKDPSFWTLQVQACVHARIRNIIGSCAGATGNQTAINIYGACNDVIVDGYYGNSQDDAICIASVTATNSTGSVYPVGGVYPGGTCKNITVRNMSGTWAQGAGNVIRVIAGDGQTVSDLFFENINNQKSPPVGALLMTGAPGYYTTPPTSAQLTRVTIRNFSGPFGYVFYPESSCSDVSISGGQVSQIANSIYNGQQASITVTNFRLSDVHIINTTGAPALVYTAIASHTLTGASFHNIHADRLAYISYHAGVVTGLDIKDVYVDTLVTSIVGASNNEAGFLDGIAYRTFSGTIKIATATKLKLGPRMPLLTSADTVPSATTKGSRIVCDHTLDPTGGASGHGGEYIADGTNWVRVVDLGATI